MCMYLWNSYKIKVLEPLKKVFIFYAYAARKGIMFSGCPSGCPVIIFIGIIQ